MASDKLARYSRFAATTAGQTSILRFAQYLSRFLTFYCSHTNRTGVTIQQWAKAERLFEVCRRVVRAGIFVAPLHSIIEKLKKQRLSLDNPRANLRTLQKIACASYLVVDAKAVLETVFLGRPTRSQQLAYKLRLADLATHIACHLYDWYKAAAVQSEPGRSAELVKERTEAENPNQKVPQLELEMVSDLCNLIVYSTAAGFTSFDGGFTGGAGCLSSAVEIRRVWSALD